MDYEKAFKDAYERASLRFGTNVANELFLEYKESKEERTRRKLIEFFSDWSKTKSHCWGIRVTDIMDWLEKLKVFTEHGDGLYHFANSEFTYVGNPTWDNVSFLENQCEHKPFDYENATIVQKDFSPNKEPKFNIGDWIVSDKTYISNDYRLCKVVGIGDGCYTIQTINGWKGYNTFKEWENDYRLWTIQDAKAGDLLADDYGIYIFDRFDEYDEKCYLCMVAYQYSQKVYENEHLLCSVEVHPATKEQRDTLFAKMREAGYEWDTNNKELKKK